MDEIGDTRRLLILDDVRQVGATIAAVSRTVGLEARFVTEPKEFFILLEEWKPQLLVIDLVMPQMDGVEVIRMLAQQACTARLIISSGVGARVLDAARRAAAEHGLDIVGVLPKPFRTAELRSQLAAAMQQGPARPAAPRVVDTTPITETELATALRQREFRLAYQPKVQCRDGLLVGFEALLRWSHPTRGTLTPDSFIAIAERSELIDGLTSQVCEMGLTWLSQRFRDSPLQLSINVSAPNLERAELWGELLKLCGNLGISPSRVTLELTETAAMRDPVSSLARLTQLRMQGFGLSIDDFGTGYSSMVQLVRLPFSEMKVDRSFVMTALQSAESRAVITSIAGLARSLGLSIAAEGLEDRAVIRFLNEAGCDYAQGYAIGRPLAPENVDDWMEHWAAQINLGWLP